MNTEMMSLTSNMLFKYVTLYIKLFFFYYNTHISMKICAADDDRLFISLINVKANPYNKKCSEQQPYNLMNSLGLAAGYRLELKPAVFHIHPSFITGLITAG